MNVTPECNNLDSYLADDLPINASARFAQHLDQCEPCREAAEQQRWIDSLLRSDGAASLEPVPCSLRDSLRKSIRRRQTTRLNACGLAAAATIAIVAASLTLQQNRESHGLRQSAATDVAVVQPDSMNPNSNNTTSRATFISNDDTIAVPIESRDANVTIVLLYPTTEAERRTRRQLALQELFSESNGG